MLKRRAGWNRDPLTPQMIALILLSTFAGGGTMGFALLAPKAAAIAPSPHTGIAAPAPSNFMSSIAGGRTFQKEAAAASLRTVDLHACYTYDRAITFHSSIVFSPSGDVSGFGVDEPSPLRPEEAECVRRVIVDSVHVPAFAGRPVRVGKTFGRSATGELDR